jgi:hypothetical protein
MEQIFPGKAHYRRLVLERASLFLKIYAQPFYWVGAWSGSGLMIMRRLAGLRPVC